MSTACASSPVAGPSVLAAADTLAEAVAPQSLIECPSSPNCVSSLASTETHGIKAFAVSGSDMDAFQATLVATVTDDGGVIADSRPGYLWATYTSTVFRFVDDVEWLYNAERNEFDVRSASRTGYSDLGVNRRRIERLRAALTP